MALEKHPKCGINNNILNMRKLDSMVRNFKTYDVRYMVTVD